MPLTYTVLNVGSEPRKWGDPPNGPFLDYKVTFTEHSDTPVSWSKKLSSKAPQAGDNVTGDIDWNAKFGPKFKQHFENKGGGRGASADVDWDRKDAEKAHWAAAKVAAHISSSAGWFGTGFDPQDTDGQARLKLFSRLCLWLERDAQQTVDKVMADRVSKKSYGEQKNPQPTGQSDVSNDAPQHQPVPTSDLPF